MKKILPLVNNQEVETKRELEYAYSDLIIDYLLQINIGYIFGVPGGAIEPLFDAIFRNANRTMDGNEEFSHKALSRKAHRNTQDPIKLIVSRHEAGAVFMADGYYRETGKLGVCCATTGPGSTNLITGVATAYVDQIPMLVITPQTALPNFGKRSFQESSGDAIDIISMMAPCTRYNSFVSHAEQLESKLFEAIYTAFQKPYGPVHLSIPMDIMATATIKRKPSFHVASMMRQAKNYDEQSVNALQGLLMSSKKVALYLGEDCLKYAKQVCHFAELINAEIVTTPTGKGAISSFHPLYRGVFGFAGHQSARDVLGQVDTVLAIGTALGEFETGGWCRDTLLNEKLVHIDASREHFSHSAMARLHVYGHLGRIFEVLINKFSIDQYGKKIRLDEKQASLNSLNKNQEPVIRLLQKTEIEENNCQIKNHIKPQFLMRALGKLMPKETRYYIDTGNAWAWATHYLNLKNTGNYNISMGFGAMGWAIGAAVGGSISAPKIPTLCITGDGAYLMSGQEITVAIEHQLPIMFLILNDQALGMIKHGQRLGGGEQIGFELPKVDFALMAKAVGANGVTINSAEQLLNLDIEELTSRNGPTLIDVHIDPEEVPPMGSRMKALDRGDEK